jgi:hypothetical protein
MRYRPHRHELRAHDYDHPRKGLLWGAAFVAVGTAFLLERLALLDLTQYLGPHTRWWHFLPLLLTLGGAIALVSAESLRQVLKGVWDIVLGVWVFACLEQLWGLTFANSWPILLIAIGLEMLLRGWFGGDRKARSEVAQ